MLILGPLGIRDYVVAVIAATHCDSAKVIAAKQETFCLTPIYRTGLLCLALLLLRELYRTLLGFPSS